MHEFGHQLFHVLFMLAFLAAIAAAFVSLVLPLVAGERPHLDRWTLLLGSAAVLALAADWAWHRTVW